MDAFWQLSGRLHVQCTKGDGGEGFLPCWYVGFSWTFPSNSWYNYGKTACDSGWFIKKTWWFSKTRWNYWRVCLKRIDWHVLFLEHDMQFSQTHDFSKWTLQKLNILLEKSGVCTKCKTDVLGFFSRHQILIDFRCWWIRTEHLTNKVGGDTIIWFCEHATMAYLWLGFWISNFRVPQKFHQNDLSENVVPLYHQLQLFAMHHGDLGVSQYPGIPHFQPPIGINAWTRIGL